MELRRTLLQSAAVIGLLAAGTTPASGQDIEPRSYSNAPIGVNFLIIGYVYTDGGLAFDSAVPVTNPKLTTSSALAAWARVLRVGPRSAKCDVIVPYSWLDGSADYLGEHVTREVSGFMDPRLRFSLNLVGAPALSLKEFAGYQQNVIVGASVQVSAPVGQYDPTRLLNLGTNRWYVQPELGVSKRLGHLTMEAAAAATFFSDNDEFYRGLSRSQDPLYSFQGHVIYGFRSGVWAAFDANYFTGGQVSLDGDPNDDRQENWRLGGTVTLPVNRRNSIKLQGSRGVSARTGNDFDSAGIAWQFRWGGGI